MSESLVDEAKVKALPKEGVHCFPASAKQIKMRRIITIPLCVVFVALGIFFLVSNINVPRLPFAVVAFVAFCISAAVFAHTFLIAGYRVAIDYNEKKFILRYRYSKIFIPFEQFDARDGNPDKAEELLQNSGIGGNEKVNYLVLDDVLEDACYQTTNKDLASDEDFIKLRDEAFKIAEAYNGKDLEGAIKMQNFDKTEDEEDEEINDIVKDVMDADSSDSEGESDKESEEDATEEEK